MLLIITLCFSWMSSLSVSCMADLIMVIFFSVCFPEEHFVYSSFLKDNVVGYNILSGQGFYLFSQYRAYVHPSLF